MADQPGALPGDEYLREKVRLAKGLLQKTNARPQWQDLRQPAQLGRVVQWHQRSGHKEQSRGDGQRERGDALIDQLQPLSLLTYTESTPKVIRSLPRRRPWNSRKRCKYSSSI